jgi:MoaA/NifB/PqqE/SkfB family radical SAM enzyme
MKDAYILLTVDCNNDCLFCSAPKKDEYLLYEEIVSLVDDYIDQKYEQFTLTGGEPTLHPKLFDIIKYIRSKNVTCRMITNGTNLTKEMIAGLVDAELSNIVISIHTLDPKKAKYIAENEDYNLPKILEMVEFLHNETPIVISINFTITGVNYKDMPSVAQYIANHRYPGMSFNFVDYSGNATQKNLIDEIGLKYSQGEKYFYEAFNILKKAGIFFRVERMPMCYLIGLEEYSSDFNRLSENEHFATVFLEGSIKIDHQHDYVKGKQCEVCKYGNYCFGVHPRYSDYFTTNDLVPVFHDFPVYKSEILAAQSRSYIDKKINYSDLKPENSEKKDE